MAQRRRRHRVELRDGAVDPGGEPALSHGDLHRSARRSAADPQGGRRQAPGHPPEMATATRPAWSSPPTPNTRGGSPSCCGRRRAGCRWWCCTPRPAPRPSSPRSPRSTDPWIVAVNMVSEGVDIPRLRVGVYATAAKTPLIFRQIVGRFVRDAPRRPSSRAGCTSPPTRSCATTRRPSSRSCAGPLRRPGEQDPFALDEREPSAGRPSAPTLRSSSLSVPMSRPQMTLFGAPAPVPPPPSAAAARWVTAMADPDRPAPATATATRQAARRRPARSRRSSGVPSLRDERHRLVSEVRRRDGTSHREINAWLNRKVGHHQRGGGDAGRAQRSVDLLMGSAHAPAADRDARHATVDLRVQADWN